MREPWVGAIVAFFLFLAADPLQISTLKVQAQVVLVECCMFKRQYKPLIRGAFHFSMNQYIPDTHQAILLLCRTRHRLQ